MIQILRVLARKTGLNRIIYKFIYGDDYEKNFDQAILKFCHKGSVIFDVGANRGHYISKFIEKGAVVYAFEPDPLNYSSLQREFSHFSNVHLINAAIGSETGKVYFQSKPENEGVNSAISAAGDLHIQCYALDDFCRENSLVPDIVKVDVEGHELEVLEGSKSILKETKLVAVEIHNEVLNGRGVGKPNDVVRKALMKAGFSTRFTDFSHIIGYRL